MNLALIKLLLEKCDVNIDLTDCVPFLFTTFATFVMYKKNIYKQHGRMKAHEWSSGSPLEPPTITKSIRIFKNENQQ